MKRNLLCLIFIAVITSVFSQKQDDIVRLKIVGFSDLHGNFFQYDHLSKRPATGGFPYIYSYLKQEREDTTQHLIVMNSGDYIAGSIATYFYNFMDTRTQYMPSVFLNKLGVDVSVVGNHDLETGSNVFRRFESTSLALNAQLIGANVTFSGGNHRLYANPYTILNRGGLRIAVLGLLTPTHFQCVKTENTELINTWDMLERAEYWVNRIQKMEEPDLIIGLFHAGFMDSTDMRFASRSPEIHRCYEVNDPMFIARQVPGFDAIILGHKHNLKTDSVHVDGKPVWLVEPGHHGSHVGVVDFELQKIPNQKPKILNSSAKVVNVFENRELTPDIIDMFADEEKIITEVANEFIAILEDSVSIEQTFFGPSFLISLNHKVQLEYTGAEVSFTSPLSLRTLMLEPGNILLSDLHNIHRYENKVVMMPMYGREIKGYLEYSYGLWIHQMQSPDCDFLRLRTHIDPYNNFVFEIPEYNFDTGAGLDYEVDVRKPTGERITIKRMWSNRPFHQDSVYNVAMNSFRYSGGGGHLELGAKINREEVFNRAVIARNYFQREMNIVDPFQLQVRELIRRELERQERVNIFQYDNWKFVPEEFVISAKQREIDRVK